MLPRWSQIHPYHARGGGDRMIKAVSAGPPDASFERFEKLDQGGPIARGHLCRQAADCGESGFRAVRDCQQAATVGANPGANRRFRRGISAFLIAASCFFRRS